MNKTCSNCLISKSLDFFHNHKGGKHGKNSVCIQCKKEIYFKNKQKINAKRKIKRDENKEIDNEKRRIRYEKDEKYREEISKLGKTAYKKHREKKLKNAKDYQDKPENKVKRNEREKKRRQEDPQFKMATYLRNRIGYFFKNRDKKPGSAIISLGCTLNALIVHIESLWRSNMNWDNYGSGPGKWEIDHIKPLCSFNLSNKDQFYLACHYTNLQPLWHEEHVLKTTVDINERAKV